MIHLVRVCPDSGSRWKNVAATGKPPSSRTYHTNSACLGDRLYVFSGGEAGAAPVSDPKLHVFDTGLFKINQLLNIAVSSSALQWD